MTGIIPILVIILIEISDLCSGVDSMTHYCTLNPQSTKTAELKTQYPSASIVTPEWIISCHKAGAVAPFLAPL